MKRIKLQSCVLTLVLISGLISLLISSLLVIHNNKEEAQLRMQEAMDSVHRRLDWQLLRVELNLDAPPRFPDFGIWKHSGRLEGMCIQFHSSSDYSSRSLCKGATYTQDWPAWFERFYNGWRPSTYSLHQPLIYEDTLIGQLEVSTDPMAELQNAWDDTQHLVSFLLISVILTCATLYISLRMLLSNLNKTQSGLATMQDGQLNHRIPTSPICEWQAINQGIHDLAGRLSYSLEERNQLLLKMLNIQDSERRHISRELHDEFGQQIAGLAAVSRSLMRRQDECSPSAQQYLGQIEAIRQGMNQSLHSLLLDLRPGLLDEATLEESLKQLIEQWNLQQDQVFFELFLNPLQTSPPPAIADNLYRITQECISNIIKHSKAGYAAIRLAQESNPDKVWHLKVSDDGQFNNGDSIPAQGKGLLGIRERATLMNAQLSYQRSKLGGMKMELLVPIEAENDEN
jgi:two-component system sensor histidine kinase UhpB